MDRIRDKLSKEFETIFRNELETKGGYQMVDVTGHSRPRPGAGYPRPRHYGTALLPELAGAERLPLPQADDAGAPDVRLYDR